MNHIVKYQLTLLSITLLFITVLANADNLAKPLPIEYFAKHSTARDVKISPEGKYYAGIFEQNGEDVLAVFSIETRKPVGAFRVRGERRGVGDFFWVSNERLVYEVTLSYAWNETVMNIGELWGVNIDGSQHKMIFGYRAGKQQIGSHLKKKKAERGGHEIIDLLKDDPRNILVAFYPWKLYANYWASNPNALVSIYKLNVTTGKKKKISTLPHRGAIAITDINSKVRFAIGTDENNQSIISYKKTSKSEWQNFSLKNFEGENVQPLSFTADNQSVYLSANVGKGTKALYLFNLSNETIKKIYHNELVDINSVIYDYSKRKIIAVATEFKLPKYYYLDKKDPKAKIHKKLQKAFKGQDVRITSETDDGSKLIAYVYSDTNPGDYYLFDTKKMGADYILSPYSWINPELMASTELLEFTMRDGTKVQGYLTRPKKSGKEKLPIVVRPHGGPHGIRDWWGFNWIVQLLANKGYAVLQVNYRGSGGFGGQFEEAGHGNWGTLMQDDITDATNTLIEMGIADPKRICIYGGSYGGYAALMGAVREPDLYQCAIGFAGVYDLPLMFTEGDIADRKSGLAYLKEAVGDDIEDLKKRSPVYNVDKIKANILLIHGAKDDRVPIEHAEKLMKAFDEIGKKYEWLELGDEAHGYQEIGNRVVMYKKILKFLDKNIGANSDVKH